MDARIKPYRSRSWPRELSRNSALYLMVLLPVAVVIIFKYIPMYGAQIAFRNYKIVKGVWGSDWVGFKHFLDFFNKYQFWQLIRNTLLLNLYNLATFPLPLCLALCIHYLPSKRFSKSIQLVSYAPHFISTVVLCGMLLQMLSFNDGLFNALLGALGVAPVNFMADPGKWRSIYVWSGVWQEIGFSSIIYVAALSSISPELHESAKIDGASIFQRILHVDIPGVLPTFLILLILKCGTIMTVGFEKVYLLQNSLNPDVSSVISTYVYSVGIAQTSPRYSYASAVDMFTNVINMILLFSVNASVKAFSDSSLW